MSRETLHKNLSIGMTFISFILNKKLNYQYPMIKYSIGTSNRQELNICSDEFTRTDDTRTKSESIFIMCGLIRYHIYIFDDWC